MEQSINTNLLSRALLKDKSKGALSGKYGKCILAFLTVSLLTLAVQTAMDFVASMLLSCVIVVKEHYINNIPLEQIEILVSSTEYMQSYMDVFLPIDYVLIAISSVFTSVFKVGLAYFFLNIACGRTAKVSDIFYGFKNQFGKCLKLSAVFVLMSQLIDIPTTILNQMSTDTALSTETLILIISVLIVCIVLYVLLYLGISQMFFLILDFPNYSATELIKLSIRIMKGYKSCFLWLELSFIPLILLGLLSFGIGNLWLNPYMQLTYTFFFLHLMQTRTASSNQNTKSNS